MKSLCDNSISREKSCYDDEGWKDDNDDAVGAVGTDTAVWDLISFHTYILTSVWLFFFREIDLSQSGYYILTSFLTKPNTVLTRFRQETCQDALIILWQNVYPRKTILIFYTSVFDLISLRAPSKTNNLKCSYKNPSPPSFKGDLLVKMCYLIAFWLKIWREK